MTQFETRKHLFSLWIQFIILRQGGISRSSTRTVRQQVHEAAFTTTEYLDTFLRGRHLSRSQLSYHHIEEALARPITAQELDAYFEALEHAGAISVRRDKEGNLLSVQVPAETF